MLNNNQEQIGTAMLAFSVIWLQISVLSVMMMMLVLVSKEEPGQIVDGRATLTLRT